MLGLVLTVILPATAQGSMIYDAAGDFSPTANPNGVWSYGSSATLGGAFVLGTSSGTQSGINWWINDYSVGAPSVTYNQSASSVTYSTATWPGTALGFHPGREGQYAVVRFTAPGAGPYNLATAFEGLDVMGTTTDVHVLVNGMAIFDGTVNGTGPGSGPTFNTTWTLATGDRVDFVVGIGANGNYYYDTTRLNAVITAQAIPEPATVVVLAFGGLALAWRRARPRSR